MERAIRAPIVHEAWNWIDRDAAVEDIARLAFGAECDWLAGVRFCMSGSEANDLALSLAQAVTGRPELATRERAYHGGVGLSRDTTVQPQWHGGLSWERGGADPAPRTVKVVSLPAPGGERIGSDRPDAERDARALGAIDLSDVAAVIVDYTQGAVQLTRIPGPIGHARARGRHAVDRRRGRDWLWAHGQVVLISGRHSAARHRHPGQGNRRRRGARGRGGDLPLARGADRRERRWQTAGTFRGHPLIAAATRAHLQVLSRHGLVERARALDQTMYRLLSELANSHPSIRRIDGRGLHWSIELHGADWRTWRGDVEREPLATRVAARALEHGALIQTSGEDGMLVLAPPLICDERDLQLLVEALHHGVELADQEHAAL